MSAAQPVERRINAACGPKTASDSDERFRPEKDGDASDYPHIGTETRPKLLREAAVRNIGQWA